MGNFQKFLQQMPKNSCILFAINTLLCAKTRICDRVQLQPSQAMHNIRDRFHCERRMEYSWFALLIFLLRLALA